jgi:integrase
MGKSTSAEEKPKVDRKRLYLTPEEARRLIAAASKRGRYPQRDKIMLRMIYRHGLRVSEACDLRWDDINLPEGTIYIKRKKMGNDSTHSMDRDELSDLRKLQKASQSRYVFTTERGGPLSVDAVQYICKAAGEACGLPDAHPHQLRHSAGYSLVNEGTDMRLIQDFLGHKTASMTMHYCAISPKRLAAVRVR